MKQENKIKRFNEKALIKSEYKPFKLVTSERGKRVWTSENGLYIEAVKIGPNEYFEAGIIKGQRLGELNPKGQKLSAKLVQDRISKFAMNYNFLFIKKQIDMIQQSEVGKQLYNDWCELRREYTFNDRQAIEFGTTNDGENWV